MATIFEATVPTAVTPTDEDDPPAAHNGKREAPFWATAIFLAFTEHKGTVKKASLASYDQKVPEGHNVKLNVVMSRTAFQNPTIAILTCFCN